MTRTLLTAAGVILLGVSLSACLGGGGGGGGSTVVTPPAPTPRFAAAFGANFDTAFAGSANSEPKDVAAGDAIPVSLTAEPVTFPGT